MVMGEKDELSKCVRGFVSGLTGLVLMSSNNVNSPYWGRYFDFGNYQKKRWGNEAVDGRCRNVLLMLYHDTLKYVIMPISAIIC